MSDEFDFEPGSVDRVLLGGGQQLEAPDGTWASIMRRARRRKRAKALLAAATGVCVVAGAIPAVLAVRGSSDNERLKIAASPPASELSKSTSAGGNPVVRPSLNRLVPTAVSFVTQSRGWVSGVLRVKGGTVAGGLAHTEDAGATWVIEAPRPMPEGTVRFADSKQGLSFGDEYQMTNDGGLTWQTLPSPGYIADLETANGVIWALVRSDVRSERLELYQATLIDPTLARVSAVAPIGHRDAAITLRDHAIYVTGGHDMWATTNDGFSWRQPRNPCGGGSQSFATWSARGIAAECTPTRGVGSIFESLDAGQDWTNIANVPHVRAAVGTLSAGSPDDLMITTGSAPPFVSHHHGSHWGRAGVIGAVSFAAYISDTHVVGIAGGRRPTFVTSFDAGRTWTQTPFRVAAAR